MILCSINDIDAKYYADGEDAYGMRKTFTKDTKAAGETVDETGIEHDLENEVAKLSVAE